MKHKLTSVFTAITILAALAFAIPVKADSFFITTTNIATGLNGYTATGFHYSGYAVFKKPTSSGWGWSTDSSVSTSYVEDIYGSGTELQYYGMYSDTAFAPTLLSIDNPTFSPVYRFVVFFPYGTTPPSSYALYLTDWNQ